MSSDRPLANWLETKYIEWRNTQDRKHGSLNAFSKYLGIKESLLNAFVNKRRTTMSQSTADLIADKLGDEIYGLVNRTPPDPYLRRISRVWNHVSEARKRYLVELAEKDAGKDKPPG